MKGLQQICQERLKVSLACVGLMVRGVTCGGKALAVAQQENKQLVQRLALLRADYNQLRQETNELLRYADQEIADFKRTNAGLAREFDDLQLRVWELEQQVDELLLYVAELTGAGQAYVVIEAGKEGEALAEIFLGIVGGHDATRRR